MINLKKFLRKTLIPSYKKKLKKYLSSLDYKEFKELYNSYTSVLSTLMFRYSNKKYRKFSRKWFNNFLIKLYYYRVRNIFAESNMEFHNKLYNELKENNIKTGELIKEIKDVQEILINISRNNIISMNNSDKENIMKFYALMSDNIYFNNKYNELKNKLNDLKND